MGKRVFNAATLKVLAGYFAVAAGCCAIGGLFIGTRENNQKQDGADFDK
jgi:hypothetical protein